MALLLKFQYIPQPGQTVGTIGLAVGYGRTAETLKVAFWNWCKCLSIYHC